MAKSAKEVREKFAEENMYCEIHEHENGCISIESEIFSEHYCII